MDGRVLTRGGTRGWILGFVLSRKGLDGGF